MSVLCRVWNVQWRVRNGGCRMGVWSGMWCVWCGMVLCGGWCRVVMCGGWCRVWVELCVLGVACDSQRDHPIMLSNESAKGVFEKLVADCCDCDPKVYRTCSEVGPKKGRTRLSTTLYLTRRDNIVSLGEHAAGIS